MSSSSSFSSKIKNFEDSNEYWYTEVRKCLHDIYYDSSLNYYDIYNNLQKVDSESPVITEEELDKYFKEFSLQEFGTEDYTKTIIDISKSQRYCKEYLYQIFQYIYRTLHFLEKHDEYYKPPDYLYLNLAQLNKLVKFIESKGIFRYSYFDFYRKSHIAVKAKFGELELTPENFELVHSDISYYPFKSFIVQNNGMSTYYIKDITKPGKIHIEVELTLTDFLRFRSVNRDSKFNKRPWLVKFVKNFMKNPKILPDRFILDDKYLFIKQRYTVRNRFRSYWNYYEYNSKCSKYRQNMSQYVGFTKKQIKEAIVNAKYKSIPTDNNEYSSNSEDVNIDTNKGESENKAKEFTFIYEKKYRKEKELNIEFQEEYHVENDENLTVTTKMRIKCENKNNQECNHRLIINEVKDYYQDIYRYMFNTYKYIDINKLCKNATLIQRPDIILFVLNKQNSKPKFELEWKKPENIEYDESNGKGNGKEEKEE